MICPPLTPSPMVVDWIERHRNPTSFMLHMIGIPPTILGVLLIPTYLWALSFPTFFLALCCFMGGYFLQFLGHGLEGSDPGEVIYFKRKWGWAYVEIAPARVRRSRRGVA